MPASEEKMSESPLDWIVAERDRLAWENARLKEALQKIANDIDSMITTVARALLAKAKENGDA